MNAKNQELNVLLLRYFLALSCLLQQQMDMQSPEHIFYKTFKLIPALKLIFMVESTSFLYDAQKQLRNL
jgi:hypothetical protein